MKTANLEDDGSQAAAVTRGRKGPKRATSDMLVRDQHGTEVLANEILFDFGFTVQDDDDATAIISLGDGDGGGVDDPDDPVTPTVNAPITADLSNPPTQAELETAIGEPATAVPGQVYQLIDSDTGLTYLVASIGETFVLLPTVETAGDAVTLTTAAGTLNDFHAMWSAAQYDPVSNKTFWTYITADSDIEVRSWDHATQTVSSATSLHSGLNDAGTPSGDGDSHAQPALLIRSSDRKVIVAYCAHNGANMYVRISSAAADISAFGAETNIDSSVGGTFYTYPVLLEISAGIYLFVRTTAGAAGQTWSYTKSTDNGATWAAKVDVTQEASEWMYIMPSKTSDYRIDFLASDKAPLDVSVFASIYHFYMIAGTFYTTDGTEITATKPFDHTAMTLVWETDGTQHGDPGQVILGADGLPRALFRNFEAIAPDDGRYMWNRYDGTTGWGTAVEIAGSGAGSPRPTCVFADGDPYTVYYTQDDGGGIAQVFRATTIDAGVTWTHRAITDAADDQSRLVTVRDGVELKVIWMDGYVDDSTDSDFSGAGFVPGEGADAQRIVVIDGAGRTEAIIQRTAGGAWQISRDLGATWEDLGGAIALDDLTDVTITSPQPDDTLRYVGGVWINDDRKWEWVTGGEDVLVWDGDDAVYDWSV